MSDLLIEYLNWLEHMCGFAERTLAMYKRICKLWIKFLDGKDPLVAKPMDLLNFIESRRGQVKNGTISRELCIIRAFYGYLFEFGVMADNPAASIPELICEPPAEKAWLTVSECFEFLKGFDTRDSIEFRNYTIAALLWSTGLRNGELCALNWRDIDLEEGSLLVRKGKGGKQRQIFLNDRIWDDLKQYHAKMGKAPYEPVFFAFSVNQARKKKHDRISQSGVVDMIRNHGKKVGLEKPVNPLSFRHSFATHMYESGVSVPDIKEMLGHDDETETTIYVHISIDAAKRFIQDHIANPHKYT